jgi:DNA-binding transcriptional LysR family regulator
MELDARLRAFAALARRGSFSAAARELSISQPAVSRHVADLERGVDAALVIRGPRGATLTPAGAFLADYVLRAESLLAQAGRGVGAIANESAGTLVIGVSTTPAYLLPRAIAEFHRAHPEVQVKVNVDASARIVEGVRAHRYEFGIVGGFSAAAELESEPLVEDVILVVGAPSMAGRRLLGREVEMRTWIYREEGSATRAVMEAGWRDMGIAPRRHIEMPSWELVKLLVARDVGVTAISRLAIDVELAAGTLAILHVPRWNARRLLSIVRHREVPLTPLAEAFLGILRQQPGRSSR